MDDGVIQERFDAGNGDPLPDGRARRDVRSETPIWFRPGLPTSSLRLAAESFVAEWYGSGFAIGDYSYAANGDARRGTFALRGGVFTHQIAYHDAAQRYEVRYLDAV